NVQARDASLLDGFSHDLVRNTAQFQVELKTGEPVGCARQLAVHVAESVFPADNVGQEAVIIDVILVVGDGADADGNAADRFLQGNTGVHQCQTATADRGHGGGTVGLHDFASEANGVGEFFDGHHRLDGAFRECAMADFASARAADTACFTDGEVREIVVQD